MTARAYEQITERIVGMLEAGTVPWRKPWRGGVTASPRSLRSGKPYRGINRVLFSCAGYDRPEWTTYKQAKQRGAHVRKGEKGWPCIFWKWLEKEDRETGERKRFPMLRVYTVFNVEQCDGLELPEPEPKAAAKPFEAIEAAEAIWTCYPARPALTHNGGRAFYMPTVDRITLPKPERFNSAAEYYSTLFHEAGHSTGHPDRLGREGITDFHRFGDAVYSREELVAEMTAAFLCAESGIAPTVIENQAAYLGGWIKVLRGKPKLAVTAAAQAQKAADLILGRSWDVKGAPERAPARGAA